MSTTLNLDQYLLFTNPESLWPRVFILGQRVEEQTADRQNQTR